MTDAEHTPGRTRIVGLSIGVVAARVGMHPQTIREYERKGLVTPPRTAGGTRRYRDDDLDRLRRIQRLTDQGLSLQAVQYVLELEDSLRASLSRIAELEARLAEVLRGTPQAGDSTRGVADAPQRLPVQRSMSVEIVHVPRPRRGPRWRNVD